MPAVKNTFLATIANGAQLSDAVNLGNSVAAGIYVSAAFTGIALTFFAADTKAGTYAPVKDGAGAAISKTVAAGDYIPLDPKDFAGIQFLKVRSGAVEGGIRVLKIAGRQR